MIDINKKYRMRDGREVRIYATDGHFPSPVHGAFKGSGHNKGTWISWQWMADGRAGVFSETEMDLIEVKPRIKRTVWLALYPLDDVSVVSGDCTAVEKGCLACVKVEIDCEEGEGL
tara:strand:- start:661 stop:1008 length:348 start_codon:yes stop_codon:yes gene_type:complete